MFYEKQIKKWEDRDQKTRKEDYEGLLKANEIRKGYMEWARIYTKIAGALISKFGEEIVLDTLEETWWNLQYEAGKTWREDFDKNPGEALKMISNSWCKGCYDTTGAIYIAEISDGCWDVLVFNCYHQVVALELDSIGGRKIGIGWCMADIGAVRGWCNNTVMDFPIMALRGDGYCWQSRRVVDDPAGYPDKWTKEISEKCGWRSIKELED